MQFELWSKLTPAREKELKYNTWEIGRWTFSKTMYTKEHALYELRRVSQLYPERIHILKEVGYSPEYYETEAPWSDDDDDDIGDLLYTMNRAEG